MGMPTGPDTDEDEGTAVPAAGGRTGRVRWRRLLLIGAIGVVLFLGIEHKIGGRTMLWAIVALLALLLLSGVIWRLPHLRRHFQRPGGPRPPRPQRLHSPFRRGGSMGGRRGGAAFRSPGSRRGPGRSGARGSGPLSRRHRSASGASPTGRGSSRRGRGGGLFRPHRTAAGHGRRGGAGSRGFRRGSGRFPGLRRGPGGSRRGPGRFSRVRRGAARRAGGAAGMVPVRRRRVTRPSTWFRRAAPGPAAARRAGRRAWLRRGRGGVRLPRAARRAHARFAGRRAWFRRGRRVRHRRAGWARVRHAAMPWRWGTALHRAQLRHAASPWRWGQWGTPAARAARRAHRARMRDWRARMNGVPLAGGRRLGLRDRARRRWRIRRGHHPGLGLGRPRSPFARIPWRTRLDPRAWPMLLRRRRTRRPPRRLGTRGPRWVRGLLTRFDRRRHSAYIARRRGHRAPPVSPNGRPVPPGTVIPRPGAAVSTTGAPAPPLSAPAWSTGTGGSMNGTAMIESLKDMIAEHLGGWNPENAAEIDATLARLHEIPEAMGAGFSVMGERLQSESAVHPALRDAVTEAGAGIASEGGALQQVYATHRVVHDDRMERIENPKPGEEKWDVTSNR